MQRHLKCTSTGTSVLLYLKAVIHNCAMIDQADCNYRLSQSPQLKLFLI